MNFPCNWSLRPNKHQLSSQHEAELALCKRPCTQHLPTGPWPLRIRKYWASKVAGNLNLSRCWVCLTWGTLLNPSMIQNGNFFFNGEYDSEW